MTLREFFEISDGLRIIEDNRGNSLYMVNDIHEVPKEDWDIDIIRVKAIELNNFGSLVINIDKVDYVKDWAQHI